MRKVVITLLTLFVANAVVSQSCFEIESIFVDACAPSGQEGKNEMVRFVVGNTDLCTSDLSVTWATASNSWNGTIQNSSTASTTAALNSTIQSCGFLKEPSSCILPANSTVILVSSWDMDVASNSFANLSDTLYIIYHDATNTTGNFANYNSGGGTRNLTMSFSSPSGCTDAVSYERDLLTNSSGGNSAEDGATVEFTPSGTATYVNYGCQAPIITNSIDLTATSSTAICPGDNITLDATVTGSYDEIIWIGNDGTFATSNTLTNTYTAGTNDVTPFYIYAGLVSYCNDTIYDSVQVTINGGSISVTPTSYDLCPGETVTLTASGGSSYSWDTNPVQTGPSITVNSAGTYTVTGNSGCGTASVSSTITANGVYPNATITGDTAFCNGNFVTLTASGGDSYEWSNSSTNTSITIGNAGQFWVAATTSCGTDTAYVTTVNLGTTPILSLTGDTILCSAPSVLVANGATSYEWSNGDTGNSSTISSTGNYYFVGTTICGTDTLFFNISDESVNAAFTMSSLTESVPYNLTFVNTSSNAINYAWDFGNGSTSTDTDPQTTYTQAGEYSITLTASNAYCTDVATNTFLGTNTEVVFPNIFSPNNDTENDEFHLNPNFLTNVVKVEIGIFNRWGQKLGEINQPSGTWEGRTMEGEVAPDGTYFYIASITYTGNEVKKYNGSFLLVR